jgi:long-chain acyl-CoA synthetase
MAGSEFDVTALLTGRRVLFAGATGFVGKVSLSMLLHRYGEQLDKIWVLVRRGSAASAQARFFDKIIITEPFEPLREKYGGEAGARAFFEKKCVVLDGDVTDPWLGMDEAKARSLKGQCEVLVNCAGLVSFNPSLEVGLNVNTYGVRHAVNLCLELDIPLVHMSTAFVAGNKSGVVWEDEEIVGYFPKRGDIDGRDFSLEQELKDCEKVVARLRESADDKALSSTFREKAKERLTNEGRDATDEKAMRLAIGRERKLWLSTQLIKAGMERAAHWGWPNTYTYTKSLGEQVIASTPNLSYALVRPSIVESAVRYPFPGWNEGFTTSAPLSYAVMKGQRRVPSGEKTILDMIPVDLVAGSLIAITADLIAHPRRRVYQQASGDSSPFNAQRSVELVSLYRRRHYRQKKGNRFWNDLLSRIEGRAVSKAEFNAISAPLFSKGSKWLKTQLEELKPQWGAPRLSALMTKASEALDGVSEQADAVQMIAEIFMPFLHDNRFVYRCDNTRSLYANMAAHDRAKIPWDPEALDWRHYFLEVHLPGLEKYVFPGLEEETERRKVLAAHKDLIELFEAATHAFRHRVAFRMVEDEKETRFTYGEVHRYAGRIGSFLVRSGVKPADRVMLVSENRPEWGMAWFGTLRAGATAVPVDPELKEAEVVNVARRSRAVVCLISEEAAASLPGLHRALAEAGIATQVHTLAQAMSGDDQFPDGVGPLHKSASPDDVASLIFTSGTTGNPKGVMLTHRNFAALVAKLAGVFELSMGDGVLSVLPLHHTFEFSAGFLLPFMRGADITYIDELTADRIGEVLETGRITGMIGVPALWQLFHRKLTQEMAARPRFIEEASNALMDLNGRLRNKVDVNLGKLLFWPVHRKFGGRLKYLVSGGSALPQDVHEAFHQLGFNLSEGYGLTESAPVLTVTDPGNKLLPGSVGRALPGIELKIHEPDGEGIGEVLAKGPNVMAGYFEDREATDAVLKSGWLYTGDLGKLDTEGRLYLVGRKKDVIIDANGKNVFPDELEEVYGKHPHIKELSIVGLPDDAGGEKVACLVVPEYKDRPRDEVRKELEKHFRDLSADMPFYRRVKVLRFWEAELPRTSTRKVKRKLVVEELKRLERVAASGEKAKAAVKEASSDWLVPLISEVLQKPAGEISGSSRLTGDLGFDSLMLNELSVALEQAGVPVAAISDLTQIQTVDDLRKVVAQAGRKAPAQAIEKREVKGEAEEKRVDVSKLEVDLPDIVANTGSAILSAGQRAIYRGFFTVQTTGRAFIPQNRNFLIAANHASHLDTGLIKVELGEQGNRMVTLGARDYFFDTAIKRTYFENFTNVIPMSRSGSLRESLRLAGEALNQGYNLLIYPEGTRSTTGEIAEFKPTLGYLALTFGVDILPLYLKGTYEALPKGGVWPKQRDLEVHIGPVLTIDALKPKVKGMARSDSYRLVTRMCEEAVQALKEGRVFTLDSGAPSPQGATSPGQATK